MDARIELQAYAAEWVRGARMVVEWDDPQPSAVKDVVQRPLRERERKAVFGLAEPDPVVAGHADHVCEERSAVGAQIAMPPARAIGEQRTHPACVDQVAGPERAAFGLQRHARIVDGDAADRRGLMDRRAVLDRCRGQKVVGVLAMDVDLVAVGQFGDHGLQACASILPLAGSVVQKAKVALDAVACADPGIEVLGAVIRQLGHIVEFGQRAHDLRGLKDHRFADREAWVRAALEDHDRQALSGQDTGEGRPTDPAPDDGDVVSGFRHGRAPGIERGPQTADRTDSPPRQDGARSLTQPYEAVRRGWVSGPREAPLTHTRRLNDPGARCSRAIDGGSRCCRARRSSRRRPARRHGCPTR